MRETNLEDLYALSPMQEGILFYSLSASDYDPYLRQLSCDIVGDLNFPAFQQAWRQSLDRTPILRASFYWEGLRQPLQAVHKRVPLPLARHDWRGLAPGECESRMAEFIQAEREKRFDLTQAPLMRLALIRTADNLHKFIWSYHHLLLDGWSRSLLIEEFLTLYEALRRGQEPCLQRRRPFKDYIKWLREQDMGKAEAFWKQTLSGFTASTALREERTDRNTHGRDDDYHAQSLKLPKTTTTELQSLLQQRRVTLNTLIQGVWALLLSHYSGRDDVIFGAVTSGRPPDLPGVESTIGVFINTLPVRVRAIPEESLFVWLRRLQAGQIEMRRFEYSPLAQVQLWGEAPRSQLLFESILNFGNYPVNVSARRSAQSLDMRNLSFFERNHFPLALHVAPGDSLTLSITYDRRRFAPVVAHRFSEHLRTLLTQVVVAPDTNLRMLISHLNEADQPGRVREWSEYRKSLSNKLKTKKPKPIIEMNSHQDREL